MLLTARHIGFALPQLNLRLGDYETNRNGKCLLQSCATNGPCIINTFSGTRGFVDSVID